MLALTGVVLAGAVEAAPIPAVLATKSSSCSELPSASVLALSSAGLPRLPFCVHAALADDGRPRPLGGGGFWKKLVMSFSPAACAAASDLCGIGTGSIPSAQRWRPSELHSCIAMKQTLGESKVDATVER